MTCSSSLLDGRAEERVGGRRCPKQQRRTDGDQGRPHHLLCGPFASNHRARLSWAPAPASQSFTALLWTRRPVSPAVVRPPQNGCSGRLPRVGLTEKPALVYFFFFSSPDFIRTTDLNELWLLLSALAAFRESGRVKRMNQHKCGAIIGKHIQSK